MYKKTNRDTKQSVILCPVYSPAKTELLPPLETCLAQAGLPAQLSHLSLSRTQSSSTPSTPEMRVHRQLSLRYSHLSLISIYGWSASHSS